MSKYIDMRTCRRCDEVKPLSKFYKVGYYTSKFNESKIYRDYICKACRLGVAKQKAGKKTGADKIAPEIIAKIRKYVKRNYSRAKIAEKLKLKATTVRGWFERFPEAFIDEDEEN
jgi:transposase-like protein